MDHNRRPRLAGRPTPLSRRLLPWLCAALLMSACAEPDSPDATDPAATGAVPASTAIAYAPFAEEAPLLLTTNDMMGLPILSQAGEPVGIVTRVMVDMAGPIRYLMLDIRLATGVSEPEMVLVPWEQFEPVRTIDVEGGALLFTGDVAALLAQELDAVGALPGDAIDEGALDAVVITDEDVPALNGLLNFSGPVRDFNLVNEAGEDLGEVEGALFDANAGQAVYALVDVGGFLGLSEKTVAVPWQRLDFSPAAPGDDGAAPTLGLDVNAETLRSAPEFDEIGWPQWPEPAEPGFDTELRTFWDEAA